MISKEKKDRYLFLSNEVKKHNFLYYTKGVSEISDIEYDRLLNELQEIESLMDTVPTDSPTYNVGGSILEEFEKYEHKTPLLSIPARGNSIEKLKNWYKSVGGEGTEIIIQPKCDGITVNIDYENFVFTNAATRGSGYIGENITANVKSITSFPRSVTMNEISVRGEALLDFDFFVNNLINEKTKKKYNNPRNAIAGILRQLDASKIADKKPFIKFYDLCEFLNNSIFEKDEDCLHFLSKNKFDTIPYVVVSSLTDLINICENKLNGMIEDESGFNICKIENQKFLCDGLVLKVNNIKKRKELGFVAKGPKWAFAFKFESIKKIATIKDVVWQTGRTGRITPVANFWEPVKIGGSNISYATLNNYNYIKGLNLITPYKIDDLRDVLIDDGILFVKTDKVLRNEGNEPYIVQHIDFLNKNVTLLKNDEKYQVNFNDYNFFRISGLHINDDICIEKSNDIIPKIIYISNPNTSVDNSTVNKDCVNIPSNCPSCGEKIRKIKGLHFCENINCPSRLKQSLSHFTQRDAINIVGLSIKTLEVLLSKGIIMNILDIYSLLDKKTELLSLDKFGEKKINNLLDSIEKSKNVNLVNFVYSLGIDGIGLSLSKQLVSHFKNIDNLINASFDELIKIKDVGEVNTNNIIIFFDNNKNKDVVLKLTKILNINHNDNVSKVFTNMSFVITGTFENSRPYYQKIIEQNGGLCSSSVSKKTNVVLIGSEAGSKQDKAESLKMLYKNMVLLYGHDEFINFIKNEGGIL